MRNSDDDLIFLEGMKFFGRVGVHSFEKTEGQPFLVDVTLYCGRLPACSSDRLEETIDYAAIFALVQTIVEQAEYDLIERLADQIASTLLAECLLANAVEVAVKKPKAPIAGQFSAVGVFIRRERG